MVIRDEHYKGSREANVFKKGERQVSREKFNTTYNMVFTEKNKEKLKEDCKNAKSRAEQLEILKSVFFAECGLSLRYYIRTEHYNVSTLGGVMEIMDKDPSELAEMLHNEDDSLSQIFQKLEEYHITAIELKVFKLNRKVVGSTYLFKGEKICLQKSQMNMFLKFYIQNWE